MARLDLTVNVDTRGADKLQGIGRSMQRTGAAMTAGLTLPIIGIGAAVLNAADEAEKSQVRFERAFDSMGAAAWTTVGEIEDSVQNLQKKSTFGDEAIRDAAGTLLTFGQVANEEFDRALQAGVDMAAFFDTDLDTAILQVGKAVNDPEKGLAALGRIGVQFTDEQKKTIAGLLEIGDTAGAQGVILAELERQFGGAAEAMTETAGGKMAQAMERLGDAGESIGVFLLPMLAGIAEAVAGAAQWFIELDDGVKQTILTIAGIVAVAGPVIFIVGTIVRSFMTIIGAFKAVGAAFGALKLLLLTNPFVALAAAVVALVALIVLNWDKIVGVFKGAMKFLGDAGSKMWTPISKGFGAAIDFIKGLWNTFARWWNSIEISVPSIDIPFVGRVGGFSIGLPDLPMLAEGGIVNRPTLALIGEAGPEAVVPLDKGGVLGGPSLTVNFNGNIEEDDKRRLPGQLLRAMYVAGVSS